MKTKLLVSAILLATAVVVYAYPMATSSTVSVPRTEAIVPVMANQESRPIVEVVFVLDTTGSMSELIQAAKDNIWSIARTMASAQPQPEIRVGLVAYRDRGDAYVTQVVELSADLDSMYARLMDFAAAGGGDGPEAVNEALYAAVHQVQWSQDAKAYRTIFLVGDAQPHMDYPDDVKFPATLQAAAAKGIVVNTVQAGNDPMTELAWQQIAQLSQGAHFKVSQGGDAIAVATPFDEHMATLSKELDQTRLFYGDKAEQERAASKVAATDKLTRSGSASTLAQRAAFNTSASGGKNFLGENELVDDVAQGRVDLAKLDSEKLPERLRDLSVDEKRKVIAQTQGRREALKQEIAELAEKRQSYIEQELKKDADVEQSLDYQIYGAVRTQAAKKGLSYGDAAPAH
jgi:Mg-chelatase subunit ChlD